MPQGAADPKCSHRLRGDWTSLWRRSLCAAIKYNRQPLARERPEAQSVGGWQAALGKCACSIPVPLSRHLVFGYCQTDCSATQTFCQRLFSYFDICLSRSLTQSTRSLLPCDAVRQSCSRPSKLNIFWHSLFKNPYAPECKTQSCRELTSSSGDFHGRRHLKCCWGLGTLHI